MARTPRERSRLGNTIQQQPDNQEAIPATGGLPAALIEDFIEQLVAGTAPLTDQQKSHLASFLTKTDGHLASRADVDLSLEDFEFQAWLARWPAGGIKIKTRTSSRSSLSAAIATILVVFCGCGCAGVMATADMTSWETISGMLFPAAVFFSLRYLHSRRPGRRRGRLHRRR
jgi:hypothetical protein